MKKFILTCFWVSILLDTFGQLITNPDASQLVSSTNLIIQAGNGTSSKLLLSSQSGNGNARLLSNSVNFATPTYVGTFTATEMAVCQKALDIWKLRLNSSNSVSIRTNFSKASLGTSIGAAAQLYWASSLANNTTLSPPYANYAPINRTDILYAMPLLINLRGSNIPGLTGQVYELDIQINSDITNWYLDPTAIGNCPAGQLDLLSALLHEIGHSLGFASSARLTTYRIGSRIFGYDTYINTYDGTASLESQTSGSTAYNQYVTSGYLFFIGNNAIAKNNNIPLKVQSSATMYTQSLVSHLDEDIFPRGIPGSLMSPGLSYGEVIHDIGNVTLGVMQDIGWDVNYITYNLNLQIGKMSGSTFTTSGLTTNFCEGVSGYSVAVKPTQNNGSTVTIPNGNVRWNLYAYHTAGKQEILTTAPTTGNVNTNTTLNLKTLSSGYNWIYNADGTILGELRCTATGSDGNTYTTSMKVSITQKPATPVLSFQCCFNKQFISFATPRATSYELYRNTTLIYSGTTPSYSYTASRFPFTFYVKAINCAGTTTSAAGSKNCFTDCSGEPDGLQCAFKDECGPQTSRLVNTGIEPLDKSGAVRFYTVVASNQLHVNIPAGIEDYTKYTMVIAALDGRLIYKNNLTQQDINLSNLSKGMYIITIQQNEEMIYKNKIIIE